MTRVTLGKSRVREIRPPGSVGAKAKWLSYSTTTTMHFGDVRSERIEANMRVAAASQSLTWGGLFCRPRNRVSTKRR